MAAGAPVDSRIVFLTGAETRLSVADWERGLALAWQAGAWDGLFTHDGVAVEPWSPAHLRARWAGGDLALGWVRRGRKDSDRWSAGEPPLESVEGYRVRISGGGSVREWDVSAASAIYLSGDRSVDFPTGGTALIEVAQLSPSGQPGAWAATQMTILAP